jgi:hypothetical protein
MHEMLTPSSCLDAAFALRLPSAATMVADATAICKHETFIVVFTSAENYQLILLQRSVLCCGSVWSYDGQEMDVKIYKQSRASLEYHGVSGV